MMEQWHYDPEADLDPALRERLRATLCAPGAVFGKLRSLVAAVLRCWLRLYHRLTIAGRENLPVGRSFILIANHASHLDALCLLSALPLGRLNRAFPVAAKDYFCVGALRALLARVVANALPFDRYKAPWQSLSVCDHILRESDNVLVFFPEGTRSGGPEPSEFKLGVGLLAAGRDLPVVPCHLAGTHAALPKGAWFPRPQPVRLTIGRPRFYAHLPATKESAKQICRELREAVIALENAGSERDRAGRDGLQGLHKPVGVLPVDEIWTQGACSATSLTPVGRASDLELGELV
jgi:1-acyl-sn-glycerol-3-phosphate acyltransferase